MHGKLLRGADALERAWLRAVDPVVLVDKLHTVTVKNLKLRFIELKASFMAASQSWVTGKLGKRSK